MKLRPESSFFLTWILAIALTLSPVMAQTQNSQPPTPTEEQEATPLPPVPHEDPAIPVVSENGNPVGTTVPTESPEAQLEAPYPKVTRTSTMLAGSTSSQKQQSQADSPGKSKWIVLAALLATGAVVAAVLLFRGFGGGDDEDATVITAGPPSVNAPSR